MPKQRPGPAGGKRDLNRKRRIADLCRAGAELMLAQGVERVTIDEICKTAGIAKGGFYRYFNGKTELVEAIIEPMVDGVRSAMSDGEARIRAATDFADLRVAYRGLAMRLAPVLLAEKRALRLYLAECNAPKIGARAPLRAWADEVGDMAERLAAATLANPQARSMPATVVGRAMVGAVERLAFDLMHRGVKVDIAEAGGTLAELLLDGLRARP